MSSTRTISTTNAMRSRSASLFAAAQRVLVGGVNSPVRAFRAVGGTPVFVDRAEGPFIIDVDGNRYIDLVGGWGPAIIGHAHPDVVRAVTEAAQHGLSFGAPCELETQLAELILSAFDALDAIRFVSSGTEAVVSAMRLARAATGRRRIVKFHGCYHGHADPLLVSAGSGAATFGTPDSAGVPEEVARLTLLAPYNDAEAVSDLLAAQGEDIAAVLVEPVAGNMGLVPPEPGFLPALRRLCDDAGALLIHDEVMTGFRVAWGGWSCIPEAADAQPDIVTLGKTIGGGMPVAAYAARRELMNLVSPVGPMYQAGTLSGHPLGMAAGLATLRRCAEPGFYERLHGRSEQLVHGLRQAARAADVALHACAVGGMAGMFFSSGGRRVMNFEEARACDGEAFARFFHAMLGRGVWLPPSPFEAMFISSAHGEAEITAVIDAAAEAFGEAQR